MYTTRPSTTWPGYVDIIDHRQGRPWCCGSCPAERAAAHIAEMEAHDRAFWQRIYDRRSDPRTVIADGHAYWIGGLGDSPKGFGGRKWLIRFHSGRVAFTDSLWHQGDVPPEWRDRLPDTATLAQLGIVRQYCLQCDRPAAVFFNGMCHRCSGGLL